jgi:hypothetical protein
MRSRDNCGRRKIQGNDFLATYPISPISSHDKSRPLVLKRRAAAGCSRKPFGNTCFHQ